MFTWLIALARFPSLLCKLSWLLISSATSWETWKSALFLFEHQRDLAVFREWIEKILFQPAALMNTWPVVGNLTSLRCSCPLGEAVDPSAFHLRTLQRGHDTACRPPGSSRRRSS